MYIDNVVHISVDEEFYYIEVGVTLNCDTIKVSRELTLKVVSEPINGNGISVIINDN